MRLLLVWACLVMTISRPVLANLPAPEDFAFGFNVESKTSGALWEVELPDVVYRNVTTSDLSDIRVFNNAGQVIPHVLHLPDSELEQVPDPRIVPFYVLNTRDDADAVGQTLRIIRDNMGTIVDIASTVDPSYKNDRTTAYLIDISALDQIPDRLKLTWKRPDNASFAVNVEVASSNELSDWSTLVKQATLADLKSGEALLVQNEIKLPARRARYLRVTWPDELREISLSEVIASFPASREPPRHRWLEIQGSPDQDEEQVFNYNTGGLWPADKARIDFSYSNVIVRAALMSRPTLKADWRTCYAGIFYSLDYQGKTLESEPAKFIRTSDRHWRFQLADLERQLGGNAPSLSIGWIPHVLTFAAEGKPPYTVAFGSASIAAAARPVDELLRSIDKVQQKSLIIRAKISPVFSLGGEMKLVSPAKPFPWMTLILWTVLLAGIAMLAWMVLNLYRQMSKPGNSSKS